MSVKANLLGIRTFTIPIQYDNMIVTLQHLLSVLASEEYHEEPIRRLRIASSIGVGSPIVQFSDLGRRGLIRDERRMIDFLYRRTRVSDCFWPLGLQSVYQ
jgi:hypothetical protein